MKKHQSRSKSKTEITKRRSIAWIVFGGVVLAIIVIAVIVDQVTGQAQGDDHSETVRAEAGNPTIQQILLTQKVADLKSMDQELTSRYRNVNLPARIEILHQRKHIYRRMLEIAKNAEERDFATEKLIEVQSLLHILHYANNLPEQELRTELMDLLNRFENDNNQHIARAVGMARVALAFADMKVQPDSQNSREALIATIRKVCAKFSEDLTVIANLDSMISASVEAQYMATSLPSLLDCVHDALVDSPSENAHLLALKARDERILMSLGYRSIGPALTVGHESGRDRFVQLVLQAIDQRVSPVGFNRLLNDSRWLEGYRWYDEARTVYVECLQYANALNNLRPLIQTYGKRFVDECTAGLQRLDRLGKPLEFTGFDFKLRLIDPSRFQNRVVWVAFLRDANAMPKMPSILPQIRALSGRGLMVVFVLSNISKAGVADLTESLSWPESVIVVEPDFRGEFGRQTPVSFDSYSLIVGHDGLVKDLGVPDNQLITRLENRLHEARQAKDASRNEGAVREQPID